MAQTWKMTTGGHQGVDTPGSRRILFQGQDVDQIHAAVTTHFAPHGLRLLDDRPLSGRFSKLRDGTIALYELGYGVNVEVQPGELPDIYNIHLPQTGYGVLTVDGREITTPNTIVGPGQRVSMRWSSDSMTLILRIPRTALDEVLHKRLDSPAASPAHFEAAFDDRDPPRRAWLSLARQFADTATSGLLDRSPLAAAHFEQLLLNGLLDAQPHTYAATLNDDPRLEHPATIRRAIAFCEEHADEPISVADMAAAARISVRALQQGFRVHLGTTPLGYLRRVRLDGAHHDLLAIAAGNAPGGVTDIALRWGFTHLSRFAALYRDAYGHPPSETLRPRES